MYEAIVLVYHQGCKVNDTLRVHAKTTLVIMSIVLYNIKNIRSTQSHNCPPRHLLRLRSTSLYITTGVNSTNHGVARQFNSRYSYISSQRQTECKVLNDQSNLVTGAIAPLYYLVCHVNVSLGAHAKSAHANRTIVPVYHQICQVKVPPLGFLTELTFLTAAVKRVYHQVCQFNAILAEHVIKSSCDCVHFPCI